MTGVFVYQQGDRIALLLNQARLLCIYILCELGSQELFWPEESD